MAGDEGVPAGPGLGAGQRLGIERVRRPRDHRQHDARGSLPADVEDAPHVVHALDRPQPAGEALQRRERFSVEDVAGSGRGPDDAVAVRGAEDVGDLVHEVELGTAVADERLQVVIEPQAGNAEGCQGRQRGGQQPAREPPVTNLGPRQVGSASSIRCRSAGSTIQPRQVSAPQRHGIAASAGQQ